MADFDDSMAQLERPLRTATKKLPKSLALPAEDPVATSHLPSMLDQKDDELEIRDFDCEHEIAELQASLGLQEPMQGTPTPQQEKPNQQSFLVDPEQLQQEVPDVLRPIIEGALQQRRKLKFKRSVNDVEFSIKINGRGQYSVKRLGTQQQRQQQQQHHQRQHQQQHQQQQKREFDCEHEIAELQASLGLQEPMQGTPTPQQEKSKQRSFPVDPEQLQQEVPDGLRPIIEGAMQERRKLKFKKIVNEFAMKINGRGQNSVKRLGTQQQRQHQQHHQRQHQQQHQQQQKRDFDWDHEFAKLQASLGLQQPMQGTPTPQQEKPNQQSFLVDPEQLQQEVPDVLLPIIEGALQQRRKLKFKRSVNDVEFAIKTNGRGQYSVKRLGTQQQRQQQQQHHQRQHQQQQKSVVGDFVGDNAERHKIN